MSRCGGFHVIFFQAEDGIRGLGRSRGVGDVYKRQGGDGLDRAWGQPHGLFPQALHLGLQYILRQVQDVLAPFPQRRGWPLQDVDPVEQSPAGQAPRG